jgi:hypothetical protein
VSTDDLNDLDAYGQTAWQRRTVDYVGDAIAQYGSPAGAFRADLADASARASVQWTAFPERVAACLGRRGALELLDARPGMPGGRALQEEYAEWRVVRHGSQIKRVELTTELPDYWALLAVQNPQRLLALVAEFAGEDEVCAADVFGDAAALNDDTSPAEREHAFRKRMLEAGRSPYNDGRRAICCMRQQSNSLFSAAALTAAALVPRAVVDPLDKRLRALRCDEAIRLFRLGLAELGRASDPLLVERLGQLAFEGRAVALDLPVGVYIQSVARGRLRTPDGARLDDDWFRFSRGGVDADGRNRFRRLVVEAPAGCDWCVSDLVDVATESRIRFGGEIADLVSVVLIFRVSGEGALASPVKPARLRPAPGLQGCGELKAVQAAFRQKRSR